MRNRVRNNLHGIFSGTSQTVSPTISRRNAPAGRTKPRGDNDPLPCYDQSKMDGQRMKTAIVIVDHGSRRQESNQMLEAVASAFAERFAGKYEIVEPAHMEIAEPSIATAYARCVERGAGRVVIVPFFLGPGKHWTADIPRLVAQAATSHPQTRYHVSPYLGIDELILDLLDKRATHCNQSAFECPMCEGTLRSGDPSIVADSVCTHGYTEHTAAAAGPAVCATCPFAAAGG